MKCLVLNLVSVSRRPNCAMMLGKQDWSIVPGHARSRVARHRRYHGANATGCY
ncbi:MAG: hypothetical protein HY321_09995 [Armatimonadetes bacterium]|nr:hypothetical protein [Armatimonadota bacterium]